MTTETVVIKSESDSGSAATETEIIEAVEDTVETAISDAVEDVKEEIVAIESEEESWLKKSHSELAQANVSLLNEVQKQTSMIAELAIAMQALAASLLESKSSHPETLPEVTEPEMIPSATTQTEVSEKSADESPAQPQQEPEAKPAARRRKLI